MAGETGPVPGIPPNNSRALYYATPTFNTHFIPDSPVIEMATSSASTTPASSGEPSTSRRISKGSRKHKSPSKDFHRTVVEVAQELSDDEIESIEYLYRKELGKKRGSMTALSILEKLQKKRVFSTRDVKPLMELLGDCGRDDLVTKFEQYHKTEDASCQEAVTTTFPETSTGEGAGFTSGITIYPEILQKIMPSFHCLVTLNSENKNQQILVGGGTMMYCVAYCAINIQIKAQKKRGLALKLECVVVVKLLRH